MVCAKCLKGAETCPGKTTVQQFDKYNLKGKLVKSDKVETPFPLSYKADRTKCMYGYYRYRYFPQMCREIPLDVKQEAQAKPRINIKGGLHTYQVENAIIV
jgi:hypothetical protein